MNTRQQGDIGEAAAILFFTKEQCIVSKPLTEATPYDLVVDLNGVLTRVQCKTSGYTRNEAGTYEVRLGTGGGNRSGNTKAKPISREGCDLVFIYCMNGDQYLYDISLLHGKTSIRLGPKQSAYRVA